MCSQHKLSADSARWFVYLIRTAAGALYTGISTDVQRRLAEHNSGSGAKALRGKGPLQLVFHKEVGERSQALKLEAAIKKLPKQKKEQIVLGALCLEHLLKQE